MGDAAGLPEVRHGHRLAADGVVGDGGVDQGHVLRPQLLDERLQLLGVHVALEGVLLIFPALRDLPEERLIVEVPGDGAHLLDIALGGVKVAVGGDGELPAREALSQDFPHHLKEHALCRPSLGEEEGVGPLHLGRASVEEPARVLAEVEFVHHPVDVRAVGADKVDGPLLAIPPLEGVPHGLQQDVVAPVPPVGLVPQHEGGPLHVRHGGGAGVGEHIHGEHPGGEGELVVVGGLEGPFPLFHGDLRDVAFDVGEGAGPLDRQGIVVFHKVTSRFGAVRPLLWRYPGHRQPLRAASSTGGQYHGQNGSHGDMSSLSPQVLPVNMDKAGERNIRSSGFFPKNHLAKHVHFLYNTLKAVLKNE